MSFVDHFLQFIINLFFVCCFIMYCKLIYPASWFNSLLKEIIICYSSIFIFLNEWLKGSQKLDLNR